MLCAAEVCIHYRQQKRQGGWKGWRFQGVTASIDFFKKIIRDFINAHHGSETQPHLRGNLQGAKKHREEEEGGENDQIVWLLRNVHIVMTDISIPMSCNTDDSKQNVCLFYLNSSPHPFSVCQTRPKVCWGFGGSGRNTF